MFGYALPINLIICLLTWTKVFFNAPDLSIVTNDLPSKLKPQNVFILSDWNAFDGIFSISKRPDDDDDDDDDSGQLLIQ